MENDILDEALAQIRDVDDQGLTSFSIKNPQTQDPEITRLASLEGKEYERVRKEEAKRLGIRTSALDKLVSSERKSISDNSSFEEVPTWPHPIEPADLLTEISHTVERFIVCQEGTSHALALWLAMTWLMDVVQVAPLAVITAPEKRCGKSQMLSLMGRLVRRPLMASNISSSALFRSIDLWCPTLLVDEADTFMRENEELRGLLNCGHTRDTAFVIRTVGEDHIPKKFRVWGAKAIAGIGHLPDTLMDRSIVFELRRKLSHEKTERLRYAEDALFKDLSSKLSRFAEDYREAVRQARPHLPETLNDRAQDNWEPLLAIADVVGGHWPVTSRTVALKLSDVEGAGESIGTELLSDILEILEGKEITRIHTKHLIEALCEDPEKSWASYNKGRPISPRQVARRLEGYGIRSKTIRIGYDQAKGFERSQFTDAFERYLSPSHTPENSRPTSQANNDAGIDGTDNQIGTVPNPVSVPPKSATSAVWDGGTDKSGLRDNEKKGAQVDLVIPNISLGEALDAI